MKKYEKLQKRMIIEGVVASVLIALVVGSMLYLSGLEGERRIELRRMQNQMRADESQIQEYTQQIDRAGVSTQIYEEIARHKREMVFIIDRGALRFELEDLKDKYRLSHLSMEVAPFETFENNELKALDVSAVKSEVTIKVGGMSDTHIFSFMEELNYRLPGLIKPHSFELTREKIMNKEALKQMKMGAIPQMVSGTIKFMWYGFTSGAIKQPNG